VVVKEVVVAYGLVDFVVYRASELAHLSATEAEVEEESGFG
jgi:hypothetical protein